MASIESYIRRFFFVGKTETVRAWQRAILSKFVSWEVQTLTAPQQVQARENIGIHLFFKTGNLVYLTKGTHTISFAKPFTGDYVVFVYGSTGSASFLPIVDPASFQPGSFVVKMPVAGYLSWRAELTTEPSSI
jgi:hypothetical protein